MRKTTAQPPFTWLVANFSGGSDPSMHQPSMKIRSTFTQQFLIDVPTQGGVAGQQRIADHKSPGVTSHVALLTGSPARASVDVTVADADFTAEAYLYIGPYTLTSGVDWEPQSATQATGSLTVATRPSTATITIGGVALTPAGGARTSGSNNYDNTLGTTALVAANIVAAINDAANGFDGIVSAVLDGSSVDLTAVAEGAAGNSVTLVSSTGTVTVSGATLAGGVDAVDNCADELASAINALPGLSASATGPVVTVTAQTYGMDYNDVSARALYYGQVENYSLSSPYFEGGAPTYGPPTVR